MSLTHKSIQACTDLLVLDTMIDRIECFAHDAWLEGSTRSLVIWTNRLEAARSRMFDLEFPRLSQGSLVT